MRDILTGLAILLLLCLTGALIAPHFISWESRRDQISAYLSDAVGQKVRVDGAIGITLFPTPTLKLAQVILDKDAAVSGEIGRMRLVGTIPPLLRGELRMASAAIDSAKLIVRPDRINAAPGVETGLLRSISIETLQIRGASLSLEHADGSLSPVGENMNGQLEASSLVGPFKGSIAFSQNDQVRTFRFSTGRIEKASVRIRAMIENELAAARSEFDGQISATGGLLSSEGRFTASGNATLPLDGVPQVIWRMTSKVSGTILRKTIEDMELTVGQGDRQAVFTGNGSLEWSEKAIAKVTLATRQIDADKLLADDNQRLPKTPEALLGLVSTEAPASFAMPWLTGEIDISAGSMILGRGIIAEPRLILQASNGVISVKQLSAELPGQTTLSIRSPLEGSVSKEKTQPLLLGTMQAESRDFNRLNTWYHGVPLRQIGPRALRLSGNLVHNEQAIGVTDAKLQADDFRAAGSVIMQRHPVRPRLELRLEADQLDIARLPVISELDGPDTMDMDIQLEARRVQFSGVGAGLISIKARREEGAILLDAFSIKDLGGASLQASGGIGRAGSKITAELDATDLDAIIQLASRLSSHGAIPALAKRADALVPARMALTLTPDKPGSHFPAYKLEFQGRLAGTETSGFLRMNDNAELLAGKALDMTISTASTSDFLQQLGLETIRIDQAGGAKLHLSGEGFPAGEKLAAWSLKGDLANLAIDVSATRVTDPAQPLSGQLTLHSSDLSPLAQTMLMAVPAVAPGQSFKARADFDLRGYRLTLRDLDAQSNTMATGPAFVKGELAFNLAEFGRVAGQLKTSEIDIRSFAPLIFGAIDNAASVQLWNTGPFGKVTPVMLPGDLWIEADSVRLGNDLKTGNARFVLRFENGLIYLEHAEADANGSHLKGAATLRRLDKAVSLSGRIGVVRGQFGGQPFENMIKGRFEGEIDFNAIADSPANLVASLSGHGRTRLLDASLVGVKPGVLSQTIRRSLDVFDATLPDGLAAKLATGFEGSTDVPSIHVPVVLAGGVLRAGPIPVVTPDEEFATSIAIDFKDFNLMGESVVRLREQPKDWVGGNASASVIWQGPMARPVRRIESTALANGLTAIAIARESQRIDQLEQEQRDRAATNRQLLLTLEEQRRLGEEKRRLEEARRQQFLRRRAEEEARARAAAARPVPAPQPPANALPRPLVITPPSVR